MDYRIFPPDEILETTVALPVSKSIAAREMIIDRMAGTSSDTTAGDNLCDDLRNLRKILEAPLQGTVDAGASGTAMRFLTALCAVTPDVTVRLTGDDSLRARPVGPLVDALRTLGADISYATREGFPPLDMRGRRLDGGEVRLDVSASSQNASALMLAAPAMRNALSIMLEGRSELSPYIAMTAAVMRRRGVAVECDPMAINVRPGKYSGSAADAERDWSAATFWYEIAALTAGWVTLPDLCADSLQGDRGVAALFACMGVVTEFTDEGAELSANPDLYGRIDADLSGMPDAVPAVAVTACMAGIPFVLRGVEVLRHKECDRLSALRDELAKVGFILTIENYDSELHWDGSRVPVREIPVFDSHGDHRMAMALAPVAVFVPGIVVRHAETAAKSYPAFWQDLENAGFRLADPSDPIPQPRQ